MMIQIKMMIITMMAHSRLLTGVLTLLCFVGVTSVWTGSFEAGPLAEPELLEAFPKLAELPRIEVDTDTGKVKRSLPPGDLEGLRDGLLQDTVRLVNTTFDEFAYYVRRGYPVVVDDFAKDWPMKGWTCEDFSREFPDGEMKAEYARSVGADGRIKVGNDAWHKKPRTAQSHLDNCDTEQCNDRSQMPHSGPHVWHVKDEEPLETRRRCQSMFRLPYFMEGVLINGPSVNESFEFWLGPPSAGAFAHSDAYCTMTASVQLNGHKRWRMMNPGPKVNSVFGRFDTQDSGVYRVNEWNPEYEFIVGEGAGIVFAPYNIHETLGSPQKCSTATTFNFFSPQPTRYIRMFLPRIINTHLGYTEKCHRMWDRYATFISEEIDEYSDYKPDSYECPKAPEGTGSLQKEKKHDCLPKTRQPQFAPSNKIEDVQAHVDWVIGAIDKSGDRSLSEEELVEFFKHHPDGEWGRRIGHYDHYAFGRIDEYYDMPGLSESLRVTIVGDVLAYHDLDDDQVISERELFDSLRQWHAVMARLYTFDKIVNDDMHTSFPDLVSTLKAAEDSAVATTPSLADASSKSKNPLLPDGATLLRPRNLTSKAPYWTQPDSEDGSPMTAAKPLRRAMGVALRFDEDAARALPGIEAHDVDDGQSNRMHFYAPTCLPCVTLQNETEPPYVYIQSAAQRL